MVFYVTMVIFLMTILMKKYTNIVVPTYISVVKYLQSLVYFASYHVCNEILLWMTEIWMKIHLVSDKNYNILKSTMPITFVHGMTDNVRFTSSVSDTTRATYN